MAPPGASELYYYLSTSCILTEINSRPQIKLVILNVREALSGAFLLCRPKSKPVILRKQALCQRFYVEENQDQSLSS